MSKRSKDAPYREFGTMLSQWRSKKHASALALYKSTDKPFSFSYSSYADFERGVSLPNLSQALEIASYFDESREAAALLWSRLQMPDDLKHLFSPHPNKSLLAPQQQQSSAEKKTERSEPSPYDVPPLSLENTWILGPSERDLMLANPWIIDAFLLLAIEYPDAVPIDHVGPADALEVLKPCIAQGRIIQTETTLRFNDPYFYLPRTKDWQKVRRQNLLRAATRMMEDVTTEQLDNKVAYQDAVTRKLTVEEARHLVGHLEQIKDTFFKTPPTGKREVYSFTAVLAPRRLKPR